MTTPNTIGPRGGFLRPWEVTLHRKHCLNAEQSARRCVVTVLAACAADALKVAEVLPGKAAFLPVSARLAA